MRHCTGESINVYETHGRNLAPLLEEAAKQLEELDGEFAYASVDTFLDSELSEYVVVLYVH